MLPRDQWDFGPNPYDVTSVADISFKFSHDGTFTWGAESGTWKIIQFTNCGKTILNMKLAPTGNQTEGDEFDWEASIFSNLMD